MKNPIIWPQVLETLHRTNGAAVLVTDLIKPEPLLVHLVPETPATRGQPYVLIRAAYVPPYEKTFSVIARTERSVWNAKGFSHDYSGLVALDVSEWAGRFDEEYFQLLLEYWADMKGEMGYPCFLLRDARPEQQHELTLNCLRFFPAETFDVRVFENTERLSALLREKFSRAGHPIRADGLALLVRILSMPELKNARLLSILDRAAEQLTRELPPMQTLGRPEILRWAAQENALPAQLLGRPLTHLKQEEYYEFKNL